MDVCRELVLALHGAAAGPVLDAFIWADASGIRSEDLAARKTLSAIGPLTTGTIAMVQCGYGRRDDGSGYLDEPTTTALAVEGATRTGGSAGAIGSAVTGEFGGSLGHAGTDEPTDIGRVRAAPDTLGRHCCQTMLAPRITAA